MIRQDVIERATIHVRGLELKYGKQYKEWEGKFADDRQVFCNLYKMLVKAYEELEQKNVTNNFVWSAVSDKRKKEEKTLKDIMKRFA